MKIIVYSSTKTLNKLVTWGEAQLTYVLFFVLIAVLLVSAFKRAWIALLISFLGIVFFAIFVSNPDMLITLATWLAEKINIGNPKVVLVPIAEMFTL